MHQELHSLFTNIPCFSPKQNALYQNATMKKGFEIIWKKDCLQIAKNLIILLLLMLVFIPSFYLTLIHSL